MLRMYVSFGGMALLLVASALILLGRIKLKGILKAVVTIIAYIFFLVGALIILFIVFSGPTRTS